MNQLEERLRTAGRSHSELAPDIESIRDRGLKIRRNRQIGTSLAAVVLVVVGGAVAFNALRPDSDTAIVSTSEGDEPAADGSDDPNRGGTPDDSEPRATTTSAPAESDDSTMESAEDEAVAVDAATEEGMGDGDGSSLSEAAQAMPSPSSVADGTGGWLTVTSDGIEHLRADGSSGSISFPQPPGGFAQRWPTDVVRIDDGHYLLVDQFVNRQDLAAERERMLAESYGVPYDPEMGASGLIDVATSQELASLEHWEIGILAVDLATDEIITVENRIVNSTVTPDWYYNGHITSDGSNIMVMRELWQGFCLYAEGLTLDGRTVEIADARIYPKPGGVESMSFDEIEAVLSVQADPPQPCRTLDELPDSGLGVWGTQADRGQIEAFQTAFFEAGLG